MMTKAEEWLNRQIESDIPEDECSDGIRERVINFYKAIQLDAYKAGMTRAAAIVNTKRGDDEYDLRSIRDIIKNVCDNLKEIPNE